MESYERRGLINLTIVKFGRTSITKTYNVEIKLGARWTLQKVFTRHTDALHYVKENAGEKYPFRVIRVIRAVVFDGEK